MSDQTGIQGGQQDGEFYDDVPDDVDPAAFQQMQAAVGALFRREYEDSAGALVGQFPEQFSDEATVAATVEAAQQKAAAMGLPATTASDVEFLGMVAAERRLVAEAEARRPLSPQEHFEKHVIRAKMGGAVLPFG